MATTKTNIIKYGTSQRIDAGGCYAISFFRPTTSNPVNVDGFDLETGQTLSIQQNVGDKDFTSYQITFYSGSASNILQVISIMPN
jgi:hypothetical protein